MVNASTQCAPVYAPAPVPVCVEPQAYANPAQLRSFLTALCRTDEWAVAEQIVARSSRLFDDAVHVPHGFFNIAPETAYAQVLRSSGGQHLPLPLFVPYSITRVEMNGGALPPQRWAVSADQRYLLLDPCLEPVARQGFEACSLPVTCRESWTPCVIVCARWGAEYVPGDVEEAVLEYSAQVFRRREPVAAVVSGLGPQVVMEEQTPLSWKIAVSRWRAHSRSARSRFA